MMRFLKYLFAFVFCLSALRIKAASILIPMDEVQKDHLKSYGIAFWILKNNEEVDWLLNYRGGSFMTKYDKKVEDECRIRGVSCEVIADAQVSEIITQVSDPSVNMDIVKLQKAPKMAVYSPKNKMPWDDAVTLVLKYAEIPFDVIYDEEVLNGALPKYDWVHMHHEDFTGQYSKFYQLHNEQWYVDDKASQEALAAKLGFKKVSQMKLAVAQKMREFLAGGGFLFAMCSGTDTFDIALSAANTDICESMFDGDAADPQAQSKLDYTQTLAFQNYTLDVDPTSHRFSDIDVNNQQRGVDQSKDFFTLFDFSAKWDVVPSMLTQDHERVIKGFMGLTTAYDMAKVKPGVTIMGEMKSLNEARYIHGEYGKGQWTFYSGHDPEDYQHMVSDPPTDLSLHPNSPGYRLILNNVLFPAAKKKKQKT
jgi:hypothetical protein